jgi:hypothetical protein
MLNRPSHNTAPDDGDGVLESPIHEFDDIQLNLLIGLRVVEHLGRGCSSANATYHRRDDELVQILNWIALFITPNYTDTYCDSAVALSAEHGAVTIHIANSNGGPPDEEERANVALLMSTLRWAFFDDSDPANTASSLLAQVVHKAFPEILRKLALVRYVEADGPYHTLHRLCMLISFWVQYRPGGECSRGFVTMAATFGRGEKQATDVLVQSFVDLMMGQDIKDKKKMTSDEQYAYLQPLLTSCDLLVRSTFFDDLINYPQYRLALEISDRQFPL